MVDISPLKGLIFNKDMVKDYSLVISPPYDVISSGLKERLSSINDYNIVKLILPEGTGSSKYINASKLLDRWINEKILVFDNHECFYIIEISFKTRQELRKIRGFIGLTRIESFKNRNIMPHEKTLSGPKEDRLRLLEQCKTNFGLIYTLYRDSGNKIQAILDSASSNIPDIDIVPYYAPELGFRLWRICDKKNISRITEFMKKRSLLIADGHHRYETSMNYMNRHPNNKKNHIDTINPQDYILTLYMDSGQENIKIYPTYRMIRFREFPGITRVNEILEGTFQINSLKEFDRDMIIKLIEDASLKGEKAFVISGNDSYYLLKFLKRSRRVVSIKKKYDNLDINILHRHIIDKLKTELKIDDISFTNSASEVLDNIKQKKFDLGIFLNSPSVREMEEICLSGYLMPQKSTYFYPKPPTGLVLYKFDR